MLQHADAAVFLITVSNARRGLFADQERCQRGHDNRDGQIGYAHGH